MYSMTLAMTSERPSPPESDRRRASRERRERARQQLAQALLALPNLAKLIGRLAVSPKVPAREKAILAATIAYLASPLDLIPDVIPIIGEVDDIFLVALVLQRFINVAGEELVLENWDGDPEVLSLIREVLQSATMVLPKRVRDILTARAAGGAQPKG
jgi:uncharacterized membrane protein YkvA (DUF1232 family)